MKTPREISDSLSRRLSDLNLSASDLTRHVGLSAPFLSQIQKGTRTLSLADAQKIDSVLTKLEKLQSLLLPFPVDLTSPDRTRYLIEQMNNGRLKVFVDDLERFQRKGGMSVLAGQHEIAEINLVDGPVAEVR